MTYRPQQRRGLGRGLGSLIPTAPRPEDAADRGGDSAGHQQGGLVTIDRHADQPADEGGDAGPAGAEGPARVGHPETAEQPGSLDGSHNVTDGGVDRAADGGPAAVDGADDRVVDEDIGSAQGLDGRPGEGPDAVAADPHDTRADDGGPASLEHTGPAEDPDAQHLQLRPVEGASFAELPITAIRANPRQPRQVFDEDALVELVHSIREVGLLQPIVVRPAGDDAYELVMGERRWRASEQAGLDTIPAIVRETGDDELLRDALLENLHRAQLNPLEEAAAYQQLLDDFGCTHDELASRIGRSRPQISNTLRLLKLSPAVQRRVAAGVLSAGHARALLGLEDASAQDRLAGRVVAEGISVRGLEEIVAVGHLEDEARVAIRRHKPTAPGVEDLAARLSDRLETRVKVDLGRRKGKITVEFASLPDLERIVAVIDPGHASRTRHESTEY